MSKHRAIVEYRPTYTHAEDEKGRMKLPAFLLTAHKAG
jgi:hypothetical protein